MSRRQFHANLTSSSTAAIKERKYIPNILKTVLIMSMNCISLIFMFTHAGGILATCLLRTRDIWRWLKRTA